MTTNAEFDGDAYLEALKLPTFRLGGRTYTGRLLGFDEWAEFNQRLTGAGAGVSGDKVVDPRRFRGLITDLTKRIYGRGRPWWAFWRPTIAERLVAAPLALQVEALKSFCKSQTQKFAEDEARMRTAAGTTTKEP